MKSQTLQHAWKFRGIVTGQEGETTTWVKMVKLVKYGNLRVGQGIDYTIEHHAVLIELG